MVNMKLKPNSIKIFVVCAVCFFVFGMQIIAAWILEKHCSVDYNYYLVVCAILFNLSILTIILFDKWQISTAQLQSDKQKMEVIRLAVELEQRGKSLGNILRDLEREDDSESSLKVKMESDTSSEQKLPQSKIMAPDVTTPENEVEGIISKFKEIALIKETTTNVNDGVLNNKKYAEYYSKEMLQFIIEQVKKK